MAVRRVVTGVNNEGKSYFVSDGDTPGVVDMGVFRSDELWVDDPARPDPAVSADPAAVNKFELMPPENGSNLRVITYAPQGAPITLSDEDLFKEIARFDMQGTMEPGPEGWHTTPTVDYGIVLTGNVFLQLDEGEVELSPGDIVVQRGTRHAWHNRGTEPCQVAFVLVSSPNYR